MKHLLQKISLLLMAMFFLPIITWGQTATKPSGSGTEQDPYQIATLENLQWLSETDSVWNAYFIQTADIDASPTSGWDEDSGFVPIADRSGFTGTYNGKDYKVEGLYINRPNKKQVGIFGDIYEGGKIDSLSVTNLNISGIDMYGGVSLASTPAPSTTAPPRGVLAGMKLLVGLLAIIMER